VGTVTGAGAPSNGQAASFAGPAGHCGPAGAGTVTGTGPP
jgi:hypothetical protein